MGLYYEFEQKEETKKRIIYDIITWLAIILLAIGFAFLTIYFGLFKMTVFDNSMAPTLRNGDLVIVNKISYLVKKPNRNDIVVFEKSGNEHSFYHIKRVIGLPGETIQIKEGNIYINSKKLIEKYEFQSMSNPGLAQEPLRLGKDEFFLLGDNRNESEDSRYANIGIVKKKEIAGRAWIRTNPFTFISKIKETKKE